MSRKKAKPLREKVYGDRGSSGHQGVPDTRSQAFKAQAHRQSLAIAVSNSERKDQAFIDAVAR